MQNEISVRQWQERFKAGDFNSQDLRTQCEAGWCGRTCRDSALAGHLKKIGKVVTGITDPFILDNYFVQFWNNRPFIGSPYDYVRFEPLKGAWSSKHFTVVLDGPHASKKWALYIEQCGYDELEFECRDVREMIPYINGIAPELQKGIAPVPPTPAPQEAHKSQKRKEPQR